MSDLVQLRGLSPALQVDYMPVDHFGSASEARNSHVRGGNDWNWRRIEQSHAAHARTSDIPNPYDALADDEAEERDAWMAAAKATGAELWSRD